jgi:hypothetical protein
MEADSVTAELERRREWRVAWSRYEKIWSWISEGKLSRDAIGARFLFFESWDEVYDRMEAAEERSFSLGMGLAIGGIKDDTFCCIFWLGLFSSTASSVEVSCSCWDDPMPLLADLVARANVCDFFKGRVEEEAL